MKKVLVLVSTIKKVDLYINSLIQDTQKLITREADIFVAAYSQLNFYIDGEKTYIYDSRNEKFLEDFDLIVSRVYQKSIEEACAVAYYCAKKNLKMIDGELPDLKQKLSSYFNIWLHDLPLPATAFGNNKFLQNIFDEWNDEAAILKAIDSDKGRNNFLVRNTAELNKTLQENIDHEFVLQRFIPNDGDYRILVLNFTKTVASLRQRQNHSHLNNVSVGGTERFIDDYHGIENVIEIAKLAAHAEQVEIAGVDVVVDKNNGAAYLMEVNRLPELTLSQEIAGFAELLSSLD